MTRLRQKYKNLKKLLERMEKVPIRIIKSEGPAVVTLECKRVFSNELLYDVYGSPEYLLPMITETAAADLCRQIIKGDLLDIEVEEEVPYGVIYRVRLKVIDPNIRRRNGNRF